MSDCETAIGAGDGDTAGVTGYVFGAFDVLHSGHLDLLETAAARCNRLIVGVSTDALYLLQEHRGPMLPFADRARMVAALRMVDGVVAHEAGFPICAWREWDFQVVFAEQVLRPSPQWSLVEEILTGVGVRVVYLEQDYRAPGSALLRHLVQRIAAI